MHWGELSYFVWMFPKTLFANIKIVLWGAFAVEFVKLGCNLSEFLIMLTLLMIFSQILQ